MGRTYEVECNLVGLMHNVLRGREVDKPTRVKVKKFIAAIKDCPEHVVDKEGNSYWGADLEHPVEGTAKGFLLKKNAEGNPITTCRVSVAEEIADAVAWELFFKPTRENLLGAKAKMSIEGEERWASWAKSWGYEDKWEAVSVEDEEHDNVEASPAKVS